MLPVAESKSKGYRFAGSDSLDEVAHWNAEVPSKVGMYKPNELGIYDNTYGNAAKILCAWLRAGGKNFAGKPYGEEILFERLPRASGGDQFLNSLTFLYSKNTTASRLSSERFGIPGLNL